MFHRCRLQVSALEDCGSARCWPCSCSWEMPWSGIMVPSVWALFLPETGNCGEGPGWACVLGVLLGPADSVLRRVRDGLAQPPRKGAGGHAPSGLANACLWRAAARSARVLLGSSGGLCWLPGPTSITPRGLPWRGTWSTACLGQWWTAGRLSAERCFLGWCLARVQRCSRWRLVHWRPCVFGRQ